jgi:hypothetical protein
MKLKRFEILLPLNYNDGRPVEPEKFLVTHRELIEKFHATTVDATRASGTWMYGGTLHEDLLMRVTIDSAQPDEAYAFFRDYKEVLKTRFEQIDVWITAHDVDLRKPTGWLSRTRTSRPRFQIWSTRSR